MSWALANTNTITGGVNNTTSITITFPNSVTAGDLVVVGVTFGVLAGSPVASAIVNDNKGNGNYSSAVFQNNAGAGTLSTAIYYKVVTTGGTGFAITITPNVTSYISAVAGEFSFTGTVTVESTSSAGALSGGPTQSSGNLAIANTDLVIAVAHPSGGTMTDPASGFTSLGVVTGSGHEINDTDYLLNQASSINPTWTASGAGNQAAAAAFSAGTSPPTTATLGGPTSGTAGATSSNFTIALDHAVVSGTVSCPISSSVVGDTITTSPVVFNVGESSHTFTVRPSTAASRTITLGTTTPSLTIAGSPITYRSVWTSQRAGTWSVPSGTASSPWYDAGGQSALNTVPGDGDLVTIVHAVTISGSLTVGGSLATGGTAAITISTGGSIVHTGGTVTVKGNIKHSDNGTTWTMSAGTSVVFYPASGAQYIWDFGNFLTGQLVINGSSGSHCSVSTSAAAISAGGLPAYFLPASLSGDSGLTTATYCDFSTIGDSTHWGVASSFQSISGNFSITNCTFTACNYRLDGGSSWVSGNLTFTHNTFSSSVVWAGGAGLNGSCAYISTQGTLSSGTRTIQYCSFDRVLALLSKSVHLLDNLCGSTSGGVYFVAGSSWPDDSYCARNLWYYNSGTDGQIPLFGPIRDCYVFDTDTSNPHSSSVDASVLAMSITGCIVEGVGTGVGECFIAQNNTSVSPVPTFTVKNCLMLPIAGQVYSSAALVMVGGGATDKTQCTIEHNTACVCYESPFIDLGETTGEAAGMIQSARANLVWAPVPPGVGHECNVIIDRSATGATGLITDALAVSPGANHNGFWNPTSSNCTLNGVTVSCSGYDGLKCSTAGFPSAQLGAGDVTANPQFVDATRNLGSWGATQGGNGTTAGALAIVAANPTLIGQAMSGLLAWVRSGFRPQNLAFKSASYSGDSSTVDAGGNAWGGTPDIGAMAFASPSSPGGFSSGGRMGGIKAGLSAGGRL